ncbi:Metacaspase-1 [Hondaea fermentalgiana]|uniref:Metacaspase-1 n=1 Tax=Hondaea fermentalgiana TaxID=2315210 RepID=A0A2R5GA31_9STRA|nr:Metacaspase-1 [Hondaea fermentalgiana]|eukprot:GBG24544.1 Metacaspase-1 [Hondaea fermentalgiana]
MSEATQELREQDRDFHTVQDQQDLQQVGDESEPLDEATKVREAQEAAAENEAIVAARGVPTATQFKEQSELAIPATVYMLAGCKDSQVSADVSDVAQLRPEGAGLSGGACTHAFLGMLEDTTEARAASAEGSTQKTWLDILDDLRERLAHYAQVPQLSCSRPLNISTEPFSITNPAHEEGVSKKRALLVGINYVGQEYQLEGCINDVRAAKAFLQSQGFADDEIVLLVDDGHHDLPTLQNLIRSFRWLVKDAKAGDSLYFHFSGHGSYVPDDNGDEVDGQDETILPLDFSKTGAITDDVLFKELVLPLVEGVHLMCFVDACHSESMLDIPYTVKKGGRELDMNPLFNFSKLVEMGQSAIESVETAVSGGMHNLVEFVKGLGSVVPI